MISHLVYAYNYSNMNRGKSIVQFVKFNYVDTEKTLHNTKNLKLEMLHYPFTKQFCLALCTVKCGLACERVTRTNPHFFINEILNFGTANIIQVFHPSTQITAKDFAFSCSFWKTFSLYITGKNVGKLTVIQTSTVPHKSVQICFRPNCSLCLFKIFWRAKCVSVNFVIKKTPKSMITVIIFSSIASTMPDILLQKSIKVKMETRKKFTQKQKSSPVTWPSKQ